MLRTLLVTFAMVLPAAAEKTVTWTVPSRGRTYTIVSRQQGVPAALNIGLRWAYAPAPILPSPQTNNQFVVLYVTCIQAGNQCNVQNQGLYASFGAVSGSNPDQINFGSPQLLLTNPPGVGDFIAPRAVYHGGVWNVYVQGVPTGSSTNALYLAQGAALTSLQWVTEGGVAKKVVQINLQNDNPTGAGIGEDHQWFNMDAYGGYPGYGLFGVYNDWNYPLAGSGLPGNGASMFAAIGQAGSNPFYWYGPITNPAYTPTAGAKYPDVMLTGTTDEAAHGDLSFTLGDSCYAGNTQWRPLNMLAAYDHPYLYKNGAWYGYTAGEQQSPSPGYSDAVIETSGPNNSGFRPRFARDAYGFLTPVAQFPRKWKTWVFYNPTQINQQASNGCPDAGFSINGFRQYPQGFGYSVVEITEQ